MKRWNLDISYGKFIIIEKNLTDFNPNLFECISIVCKQKQQTMDKEIADRMRNENSEQFQTLVRMHLSFELDLNTDSVE